MSNSPNYVDLQREQREQQKEDREKRLYEQNALKGYINDLSQQEETLGRDIKFNSTINFSLLFASSFLLIESTRIFGDGNLIFVGLVVSMGVIFLPVMAIVWNFYWLRSFRSASLRTMAVQDSILSIEKRLFDDSAYYERWLSVSRATDHGFRVADIYRYIVVLFVTCFTTILISVIFAYSVFKG